MRQWLGNSDVIGDNEIIVVFDRVQSHTKTVLEILRGRLADLLAEPSSLTVPGLSVSNSTNITELRKTIENLENLGTGLDEGEGDGISLFRITKMYRADYR